MALSATEHWAIAVLRELADRLEKEEVGITSVVLQPATEGGDPYDMPRARLEVVSYNKQKKDC